MNALIKNTLSPLGVPVEFQTYSGVAPVYITFFEYNQRSALNADDQEIKTAHSIQIDIWSKGDYTELTKMVKEKLIAVGFRRIMETEFYEPEVKIYQKTIRFNYVQ